MSTKQIADDLDRLAAVLLQEAISAHPPEGTDRLAVFKAVSAYHIGVTRAMKGLIEDGDGQTFADIVKGLDSSRANGNAGEPT